MKKHPPLNPLLVNDKLFIPIAKNAHRSIVQAIKTSDLPWSKLTWNKLPDLPRVVLLREPMDRLYSAYRMFLADGYTSDSFDSFVKATRSGKRSDRVWSGDMHLQPQWEAMGERNPDIAVYWNLQELTEVLGLTNIPHVGKGVFCTDMRLGPEAQQLFDDYYKIDIEMWNQ